MGEKDVATSDLYASKMNSQTETFDLNARVSELEKQLSDAKENRRRNSIKLESAIQNEQS